MSDRAAGASIFLREVQAVWPQVFPYAHDGVREGARAVGLPADEAALAALAGSGPRLARPPRPAETTWWKEHS